MIRQPQQRLDRTENQTLIAAQIKRRRSEIGKALSKFSAEVEESGRHILRVALHCLTHTVAVEGHDGKIVRGRRRKPWVPGLDGFRQPGHRFADASCLIPEGLVIAGRLLQTLDRSHIEERIGILLVQILRPAAPFLDQRQNIAQTPHSHEPLLRGDLACRRKRLRAQIPCKTFKNANVAESLAHIDAVPAPNLPHAIQSALVRPPIVPVRRSACFAFSTLAALPNRLPVMRRHSSRALHGKIQCLDFLECGLRRV